MRRSHLKFSQTGKGVSKGLGAQEGGGGNLLEPKKERSDSR